MTEAAQPRLNKDPLDVEIIGFDFAKQNSKYLESGETLVSSVWAVAGPDSALVIGDGSNGSPVPSFTAAGLTKCYVRAGTQNTEYEIENRVVTSLGRLKTAELKIIVGT